MGASLETALGSEGRSKRVLVLEGDANCREDVLRILTDDTKVKIPTYAFENKNGELELTVTSYFLMAQYATMNGIDPSATVDTWTPIPFPSDDDDSDAERGDSSEEDNDLTDEDISEDEKRLKKLNTELKKMNKKVELCQSCLGSMDVMERLGDTLLALDPLDLSFAETVRKVKENRGSLSEMSDNLISERNGVEAMVNELSSAIELNNMV